MFRAASEDLERYSWALDEARAVLELIAEPLTVVEQVFSTFGPSAVGGGIALADGGELVGRPTAPAQPMDTDIGALTSRSEARPLALRTQRLIRLNCTPFGLPWDFDPRFGFVHYEVRLSDLKPALEQTVIRAERRFDHSFVATVVAEVIELFHKTAQNASLDAGSDQKIVLYKQQALRAEADILQERWTDLQAQIRARKQETEAEKVIGEIFGFVKTAWAVAQLMAAGFGFVAAIPALLDTMTKAAAMIGNSGGGIVDEYVDFAKLAVRSGVADVKKSATAFFDPAAKVFEGAKTVARQWPSLLTMRS